MYTAELKRPVKEAHSSKKAAVDALIHDLGLETCRNVRIGNSMARGISGGQVGMQRPHGKSHCMHRLCIGCCAWRDDRAPCCIFGADCVPGQEAKELLQPMLTEGPDNGGEGWLG